jgi:tetratricopeptide (TPR) repeat protein
MIGRIGRPLQALLAASIALSGCASSSLGNASRQELRVQIRERGLDPHKIVLPFEPSEEMRVWVRHSVETGGDPEQRLEQLLRAILHRDGGGLTYERGYTATAEEVWRTGKANCLSFTHLFVGLAREIGLPVYYLRVSDLQNFEKDGDLVVASEHVTAAYGPPTKRRVLDFTDRPISAYHDIERISDLTAVALYYSNLGAQRIRQGRGQEAHTLLETAVKLDPELADAWVNLGVAERRLGHEDLAEKDFRHALEANPKIVSAYNNLASLLERQGRQDEARRLLELTDRRTNHNPFSYLALGDLSLREGRLDEAEHYFRRAQRLDPGRAEPLAALGQWALAAGRPRDAQRWLERAEQIDPDEPRVGELARSLRQASQQG